MDDEQTLPTQRDCVVETDGGISTSTGPGSAPEVVAERFVVQRVLTQQRGRGRVRVASDQELGGRLVVLKRVLDARAGGAWEAGWTALTKHPNVVEIHDVVRDPSDEAGNVVLVIMEYVGERNLRGYLQASPYLSVPLLVELFLGAGRGLAAAHAAGLVHNDFKSENVVVTQEGVPKLIDFGVAELVSEEEDGGERRLLPRGTPGYIAPERYLSASATARSDQFSWSVALWSALSGAKPFPAVDVDSEGVPALLLETIRRGPQGKLSAPWLRQTLVRGLRADPKERFGSMDELLAEVEARMLARRTLPRRVGLAGVGGMVALVLGLWASSGPLTAPGELGCQLWSGKADAWWAGARSKIKAFEGESEGVYGSEQMERVVQRWSSDAEALCQRASTGVEVRQQRECMSRWLSGLERRMEYLGLSVIDQSELPEFVDRIMPSTSYCRPSTAVEHAVWEQAELARTAAVYGDLQLAEEHLRSAREFVTETGERAQYDADYAELLEASAVVASRHGTPQKYREGISLLRESYLQAKGSGHFHGQLGALINLAKFNALLVEPLVNGDGEDEAQRARDLLAEADALAAYLAADVGEGPTPLLSAELEVARALVWYASGEHEQAREAGVAAREAFEAMGRPMAAAKVELNLGVSLWAQGDHAGGASLFAHARQLLIEHGAPKTSSRRIKAEFNLGLYALERRDPRGLTHFEFVERHGSPAKRAEALAQGAILALELDRIEQGRDWAKRGLQAASALEDTGEGAKLGMICAILLANAGSRDGESRARAILEANPDFPQRGAGWQSLVAHLANEGRCDEVRAELANAHEYVQDPEARAFTQWAENIETECRE